MQLKFTLSSIAIAFCCVVFAPSAWPNWPTYGNDAGTSKYAPLTQIDAENAGSLQVAWQWESPDNAIAKKNRRLTPWGFKATPLMIALSHKHVSLFVRTSRKVSTLQVSSSIPVSRADNSNAAFAIHSDALLTTS